MKKFLGYSIFGVIGCLPIAAVLSEPFILYMFPVAIIVCVLFIILLFLAVYLVSDSKEQQK